MVVSTVITMLEPIAFQRVSGISFEIISPTFFPCFAFIANFANKRVLMSISIVQYLDFHDNRFKYYYILHVNDNLKTLLDLLPLVRIFIHLSILTISITRFIYLVCIEILFLMHALFLGAICIL
jgi:hypothetical protein